MQKINTSVVPLYNWGDNCAGWRLLQNPSLSVTQELMPPHTSEKWHYHQVSQQVFYVLSGKAIMYFYTEKFELISGDAIHVPPGVIHCLKNESNEALSFLVIANPQVNDDRFEVEHH